MKNKIKILILTGIVTAILAIISDWMYIFFPSQPGAKYFIPLAYSFGVPSLALVSLGYIGIGEFLMMNGSTRLKQSFIFLTVAACWISSILHALTGLMIGIQVNKELVADYDKLTRALDVYVLPMWVVGFAIAIAAVIILIILILKKGNRLPKYLIIFNPVNVILFMLLLSLGLGPNRIYLQLMSFNIGHPIFFLVFYRYVFTGQDKLGLNPKS